MCNAVLSSPQCHEAFGTMTHTLDLTHQSPVCCLRMLTPFGTRTPCEFTLPLFQDACEIKITLNSYIDHILKLWIIFRERLTAITGKHNEKERLLRSSAGRESQCCHFTMGKCDVSSKTAARYGGSPHWLISFIINCCWMTSCHVSAMSHGRSSAK